MKFFSIIITFFSSLLIAFDGYCNTDLITNDSSSRQYYEIGDTISEEDQNHSYDVCHGNGNYEIGSSFKLSDYNEDIILISMNATW